jgi:hypothetical protein
LSKKLNSQTYTVTMSELWTQSEKLFNEIPALLKAAENTTYEDRTFTYARGGPGGVLPFREASADAWVILSQVTDILAEHLLHKVPRGSYDRRLALREIETQWPELANSKHFYDRYAALTYHLRNNQTYFTSLDLEMLHFEVKRLGAYMADVKGVISSK